MSLLLVLTLNFFTKDFFEGLILNFNSQTDTSPILGIGDKSFLPDD